MYGAYCAFGCLLIALVAGTALLDYACKQESCCKKLTKTVSYFVIALSILGILGVGMRTLCYATSGCYAKQGCHLSQGCERGQQPCHLKDKDKAQETDQATGSQ